MDASAASLSGVPPWASRAVLPQRRPHITIPFEHDGQRYIGGFGLISATERTVREVWINPVKRHSSLDSIVSSAAIAVSVALQYGATIESIAAGLMRKGDGTPLCPIGAFLDIIAAEEW